jgi:hypothetical protein
LWIALEVVAGGFGKVAQLSERLIGSDAATPMLEDIKEARRKLFHEGRRYALSQDQERLICALIIAAPLNWFGISDKDLVRAIDELGRRRTPGHQLGD